MQTCEKGKRGAMVLLYYGLTFYIFTMRPTPIMKGMNYGP